MKNLNNDETMHRKGYWWVLSLYEKQIIHKLRNNQIGFTGQQRENRDMNRGDLTQQKDSSENWDFKIRKRSVKREEKAEQSQSSSSGSAPSNAHYVVRNTPLKRPNASDGNKISPSTEIIGGNIYWSDSESAKAQTMMTPRRIQLLDSDSHLKAMDYLWESSPKVLESCEMTSENKITGEKRPLAEIRQSREEDKNEVHLYEASSSGREPSSCTSNFQSSNKFGKKSSHSVFSGRKRRQIIAEIRSEILQNQDIGSGSEKSQEDRAWCPQWGPCNCNSQGQRTSFWGKRTLNPNQEDIYKLALKRASGELERYKDTISAQKEQINQYKIRIDHLNVTIDDLTKVVNELTDGDLQRILDQNED